MYKRQNVPYAYIVLKRDGKYIKVFFWGERALEDFSKINLGDEVKFLISTHQGRVSVICRYEGVMQKLSEGKEVRKYDKAMVKDLSYEGRYELLGVVFRKFGNKGLFADESGSIRISNLPGDLELGRVVRVYCKYDPKKKEIVCEGIKVLSREEIQKILLKCW